MNWKQFWGICEHKWVRIHEIDEYERGRTEMPVARKYILQCEKCGDIKKVKV